MTGLKPEKGADGFSCLRLQKLQYGSVEDRFRKCRLMNTIQHIDIYDEDSSTYSQNRRTKHYSSVPVMGTTSISFAANTKADDMDNSNDGLPKVAKSTTFNLSKFSVTTKISCLYPGHDILSKRYNKKSTLGSKNV